MTAQDAKNYRNSKGQFVKGVTPWHKGKKGVYSKEVLKNMSKNHMGKKYTEQTKEKMRKAQIRIGNKPPVYSEETHPRWKGNNVGYVGLHNWVKKHLGTPKKCTICKTKNASRFEWSNISGKYLRDLNDYESLCVKCHRVKDGWIDKVAKTKFDKQLADAKAYCSYGIKEGAYAEEIMEGMTDEEIIKFASDEQLLADANYESLKE